MPVCRASVFVVQIGAAYFNVKAIVEVASYGAFLPRRRIAPTDIQFAAINLFHFSYCALLFARLLGRPHLFWGPFVKLRPDCSYDQKH